MKRILALVPILLLAASVSYAQLTGTSTMTVVVGPEAVITVGATPGFSTSTSFTAYTTTTPFNYFMRTSTGGSGGSITVQITTDFSTGGPNGGPSVQTPPTSGDLLTYTCTNTLATTACSGSQTAKYQSATGVATFTAGQVTPKAGSSGTVAWSLTNDPSYLAGSYTATATFTIAVT
jgi:hypothetical protein